MRGGGLDKRLAIAAGRGFVRRDQGKVIWEDLHLKI